MESTHGFPIAIPHFFLSNRTLGGGQAEWYRIGINPVEIIVFIIVIHILFGSYSFIFLFSGVMAMKLFKGK